VKCFLLSALIHILSACLLSLPRHSWKLRRGLSNPQFSNYCFDKYCTYFAFIRDESFEYAPSDFSYIDRNGFECDFVLDLCKAICVSEDERDSNRVFVRGVFGCLRGKDFEMK